MSENGEGYLGFTWRETRIASAVDVHQLPPLRSEKRSRNHTHGGGWPISIPTLRVQSKKNSSARSALPPGGPRTACPLRPALGEQAQHRECDARCKAGGLAGWIVGRAQLHEVAPDDIHTPHAADDVAHLDAVQVLRVWRPELIRLIADFPVVSRWQGSGLTQYVGEFRDWSGVRPSFQELSSKLVRVRSLAGNIL